MLYHGDTYVDSIDLYFGFHPVPGGVLFLPVRSEDVAGEGTVTDIAEHVLYDGKSRTRLHRLVPGLNDVFSSPTVIDSVLYYWILSPDAFYRHDIFAARYDFKTGRADSAFLFRESLATDNRYHFPHPIAEGPLIRYESHGRAFWLDRQLRTVRDTANGG